MLTLLRNMEETRTRRLKAQRIRASRSSSEIEVSEAELVSAFERAKRRKMTKSEKEAQLVSFVWGNAPEGNQGTFDTVRKNLELFPAR